jgi:hypothetical protein
MDEYREIALKMTTSEENTYQEVSDIVLYELSLSE